MTVFRIAKEQYIRDLSGEGARLFGGRWNRKGTPLLYTAESRALAAVETLVHLSMPLAPRDLWIARIGIPEDAGCFRISLKDLPPDWAGHPPPLKLSVLGEEWVRGNRTLCMQVPSAPVRGDWNVLVNPKHPGFSRVKILEAEPFHPDERLFNR
ncbi:MAG: RES family NAD+ phosphorylase [Spirochaetia bacterium]